MHRYRKRTVKLLVINLIIFATIFFLTVRNLELQIDGSIFSLGIPYENWVVLFFSIGAIARIVFELYKVENSSAYERRMRKNNVYY